MVTVFNIGFRYTLALFNIIKYSFFAFPQCIYEYSTVYHSAFTAIWSHAAQNVYVPS